MVALSEHVVFNARDRRHVQSWYNGDHRTGVRSSGPTLSLHWGTKLLPKDPDGHGHVTFRSTSVVSQSPDTRTVVVYTTR